MRHCVNENVQVYEASGSDLSALLGDAAEFVRTQDAYTEVHSSLGESGDYIVTAYVYSP